MIRPLTHQTIAKLCGEDNYSRGLAYWRDGNVNLRRREKSPERYECVVYGNRNYIVQIDLNDDRSLQAECSCLAFYPEPPYCKHTAAALLLIADKEGQLIDAPLEHADVSYTRAAAANSFAPQFGTARGKSYLHTTSNREAVDDMLHLFLDKPGRQSGTSIVRDDREQLTVQFVIQFIPLGNGRHMVGLEMKVGSQRLYIVQRIADFLHHIERGQTFAFTKLFLYDPGQHRFSAKDDALLKQLCDILRQEQRYKETVLNNKFLPSRGVDNDRMLVIPPFAWEATLPLLQAVPDSLIEVYAFPRRKHDRPVQFAVMKSIDDKRLPLRFTLDRDAEHGNEDYLFTAHGIGRLIVLDAYGAAFIDGELYRLPIRQLERIAKLKQLLEQVHPYSNQQELLRIAPGQIESFMDRVVPGLARLGQVELSEAVSVNIWYKPLKARMYLDRVRGRLLAGLEFQYGDIVINPLDPVGSARGSDVIVMRDGEKERRILGLLEHESFGRTEGGFVIEGDDAEYEFLCKLVPELEQELDVYATSAVKLRIAETPIPPKISINWNERMNWLDFQFQLDGIPEREIRSIVQAIEEKRRYYKLANGALLPLETEAFQALLRVMNGVGLHHPVLFDDAARLSVARALALLDMPDTGVVKLGRSLRELLDNMRHPEQLDFPVPERLQPVLRDYQKYGYQWMKTLAHYGFGGILADEMGLGKTVQGIAFILSVLPSIRETGRPALIVSPASLMYNWRNELARFAPELSVIIADGGKEQREGVLESASGIGADIAVDVIITSYPLLRRDSKQYAAQQFHTLLLDEAQAFKNYSTQTAQAVRTLRADYRFALTGTPIENRLDELWSIFSAVFPELFPGRREFGELTRESVAGRSRPFLLRRLKSQVLRELPEKIETLHGSALIPEQKKLYAAYLAKLREDSLKHLDSDDFGRARIKILAGITRLRQICCHPALFVEDYKGSSAKFEQLFELIEECRSAGKRMLIFSQFTSMLALIGRELGYEGVPYFYLDGSTPAAERVELCNRFNEGERELFLLSLKAGGTGLNLTGADTVVLYDLWWNPAVEQQAADRAHRIGQRNVVQIIRLVAEGTVEEKMYELQQRKRSLIDEIIEPGNEALSSLTELELRELLSL